MQAGFGMIPGIDPRKAKIREEVGLFYVSLNNST
jgi:hypothetical protein